MRDSIVSLESAVKVGDLVKMKDSTSIDLWGVANKVGIVTEISEPSVQHPGEVVTALFEAVGIEGLPSRLLEVVNEVQELPYEEA